MWGGGGGGGWRYLQETTAIKLELVILIMSRLSITFVYSHETIVGVETLQAFLIRTGKENLEELCIEEIQKKMQLTLLTHAGEAMPSSAVN